MSSIILLVFSNVFIRRLKTKKLVAALITVGREFNFLVLVISVFYFTDVFDNKLKSKIGRMKCTTCILISAI